MYKQIENINPKSTFLTSKGKRTPNEVWVNTESGFNFRGLTKKSVIKHEEMMSSLGITSDMSNDEVIEHIKNNKVS